MPVKLFHLITELSVGGAQKALFRLLKYLDRDRFAPVVACLYNGEGTVATEIRNLDIPVFDLGMTAKWRGDALGRLYRLLRREQPDILHTWLFHANLPGRVLGRLAGVPVIICAERTMVMESEWRYRLNRSTIKLVDRVIANSANVREFCLSHIGLPAEKVVVIPNGIELNPAPPPARAAARQSLGLPLESLVVGAVSRFAPVKGLDVLLRALVQVPHARLVVVGDGPERANLTQLAGDLGITQQVHWAGYRADVPHLLPAFDLFVQPSWHEGLPNTILEAMAAGLPVVATAVGGTPEVVVDGVTGLIVPPGDPMALAGAIHHLLVDTNLRGQMGRAGQSRVQQHFDIQQNVERTESLYKELLIKVED
ncbi:MAG: glycosyltransferase [Anaerolineae bacterium]|nr:glycosyltransferase [Anaerolineae bacterium]